jgi:hypothetical protein
VLSEVWPVVPALALHARRSRQIEIARKENADKKSPAKMIAGLLLKSKPPVA